jgi:arginyl-tRNA synthetase
MPKERFIFCIRLHIAMEYINIISEAVHRISGASKEKITPVIEIPPDPKLGDYALPCFMFAKDLKKSPQNIALEFQEKLTKLNLEEDHKHFELIKNEGPYLNFFVNKEVYATKVMTTILKERYGYGQKKDEESVILIESPGPNTNKPLHLGHLRNMLLGQSIYNILKFAGKDPHIVNVVNDRGVHICKSMLAYQKFGNNESPKNSGRKPDHFVGDYYVKYAQHEKDNPEMEQEVQDMLVKWENGDKDVRELWSKMNDWAYEGWAQTYNALGFNIEKDYFESQTYMHGKNIILEGLDRGIFRKEEDTGAVIIDLEDKSLGKKVLLRGNGTSVYITQDIYMAKKRYDEYKFDEMIYVVANEQEYHFKVLFEVFRRLGWAFADKCYHFSYGMVELPEGRMKSREGNVIDTDDLLIMVKKMCTDELHKRYDNLSESDIESRSRIITLAAIKFFFLKFDPLRNFVYNPKESLSFDGETGPYIEYSYARINSIFRKFKEKTGNNINELQEAKIYFHDTRIALLKEKNEFEIIKLLEGFPNAVVHSAAEFKPSIIARYLLDLSQMFNEFYHANPILSLEDKELMKARLFLIYNIQIVLKIGLNLLGIEEIDEM